MSWDQIREMAAAGVGIGAHTLTHLHMVEADDARLTAARLGEAEEHQDGRRLARPVGSEEGEDLARSDRQVEVVDRGQGAVALGQPARLDDRVGIPPVGRGFLGRLVLWPWPRRQACRRLGPGPGHG